MNKGLLYTRKSEGGAVTVLQIVLIDILIQLLSIIFFYMKWDVSIFLDEYHTHNIVPP